MERVNVRGAEVKDKGSKVRGAEIIDKGVRQKDQRQKSNTKGSKVRDRSGQTHRSQRPRGQKVNVKGSDAEVKGQRNPAGQIEGEGRPGSSGLDTITCVDQPGPGLH